MLCTRRLVKYRVVAIDKAVGCRFFLDMTI